MAFDIEGLLRLWTGPPPPPGEAEAAFRRFYTDPVRVNGLLVPASGLVTRAKAMRAIFEDPEHELLELIETPAKVVLATRVRGKQVGPLPTSAGRLPPTGRHLDLRVIDILTITDGRISNVWMAADELGALTAIDAVTLTHP